jgi:hypothetical protein
MTHCSIPALHKGVIHKMMHHKVIVARNAPKGRMLKKSRGKHLEFSNGI